MNNDERGALAAGVEAEEPDPAFDAVEGVAVELADDAAASADDFNAAALFSAAFCRPASSAFFCASVISRFGFAATTGAVVFLFFVANGVLLGTYVVGRDLRMCRLRHARGSQGTGPTAAEIAGVFAQHAETFSIGVPG